MGFSHTGVTLKQYGTVLVKINVVADTLCARDYKGFARQDMNGVVEHWKK